MTESARIEPADAADAADAFGPVPRCEFCFGERVELEPVRVIGPSTLGVRQLIPITGGSAFGAVSGRILPGGADLQRIRADGVVELDARYTIETDDAELIRVENRGIFHAQGGTPYVRTTAEFETRLEGPYAWLHRSVFIGDVRLLSAEAVAIRFFRVL